MPRPPDKFTPFSGTFFSAMYICLGCKQWIQAHDSIAVKDYPDGVTDDRKCPHCNSITTVKWSV